MRTFQAIQTLRNGQRGEENNNFVTYRYVYLEGEGYLDNNYVKQTQTLRT